MDITKVVANLNAKPAGPGHWMASCPCHNDDTESLSISRKGDKIVMKCMAGCATSDILDASGLTFADLGSESKPKLTAFDKMEYGVKQKHGEAAYLADHYDYYDENNVYLYTKCRFQGGDINGKMIRYCVIDWTNDTYTSQVKEDCPKVLYRLPRMLECIKNHYPINIVEGEKDVKTLEKLGWCATTPGGVNDWKPEYAKYFKGATVRIFPDNDKPGRELAEKIVKDLRRYAWSIKIVGTSGADKGDVTDYMNESGHNKESLQKLIDEAKPIFAPWVTIRKDGSTAVNADALAEAFNRNENYLIVKDSIYAYKDGYYQPTTANLFKGELMRYYDHNQVTYNSLNSAHSFLMCRGDHFCDADDLNNDESIINLRNGVLNINTMTLGPHSPKHKCTCQLKFDYNPNDTLMPNFTKYLNDLCTNRDGIVDEELKIVIQELMGLILSNVHGYRTKLAAFLYSLKGNSGKSQLINLLSDMLGRNRVITVQLQALKPDNRFVLSALPSARLVTCGDLTSVKVSDSSTFKCMTGDDMVHIENKGKDGFDFEFKGFMLFGCNALPDFEDDKGDHLFDRLLLIPCLHSVPEDQRDTEIKKKMLAESSAIFNWAMVGLRRLIDNGYRFSECEAIKNCSMNYRKKVDSVIRFIEENNYIRTGNNKDRVNAKDFFEKYKEWCKDEENEITHYITKSSNFAERMEACGCSKKRSNGWWFMGIKEGFVESDIETIPF